MHKLYLSLVVFPASPMNETQPNSYCYCHLCGAEMSVGTSPWRIWCSTCQQAGLKGWKRVMLPAGALAAGLMASPWVSGPLGMAVAVFILAVALAALVDSNLTLLPDDITQPLLWAGLLFNATCHYVPLESALLGAVGGYLSLWLLYWAAWFVTKEEAFGYGDLKLVAAMGAWLGWYALPVIFVVAALLQATLNLLRKLAGKQEAPALPFGPALAAAGVACLIGFLYLGHGVNRFYQG